MLQVLPPLVQREIESRPRAAAGRLGSDDQKETFVGGFCRINVDYDYCKDVRTARVANECVRTLCFV